MLLPILGMVKFLRPSSWSAVAERDYSAPHDSPKPPHHLRRAYALPETGATCLTVRFVSISTLIAMKQLANRPRDLDDVEHLRMIMEERRRNESGR